MHGGVRALATRIRPAFFQVPSIPLQFHSIFFRDRPPRPRSRAIPPSRSIFSSAPARAAVAEAAEEGNAAAYGAGWDGGGGGVKVGVWWDFENCNVPCGMDAHRVGINIVAGLRSSGFKGPVTISGYGDMLQLSRSVQESLSATGIRLHHVPSGGRDSESSDRALLMDLILWTIENPPPAHLFLISGDRDFSTALHKLRMRNYNVLLACPAGAYISPSLLAAATRLWYWNSLVRGEALVAATSSAWSIDGPAPRPVLPPVFKPPPPPPPPPPPGVFSSSSSKSNHKVPYFSSPPPFSYPPVPPPFSSPSPSPSPSAEFHLPPLPPETPPVLSPYSVASPNFPSVSSAPLPVPPPPPAAPPTRVSETSKTSSKSSTKPAAETKYTKPVTVPELLARLDNLLKAHPKGLWFADLQTQMISRKIVFDNDYYGHKKLVPYLLTLPRLARVERHLMKDNKTWSYVFFPGTAPASEISSSKRAEYPTEVLIQLNDVFREHHPKGIWLPELHAQLVARNIRMETNFYGHGKIVPFLLSLPEMVTIERRFASDRWSYIFLWNEDGGRKLELARTVYRKALPVKKGVVVAGATLEEQAARVCEADRKDAVHETSEVERDRSQVHDEVAEVLAGSAKDEGVLGEAKQDYALVAVEEQTVTLYSRVTSAFGFLKNLCRKFIWPREKPSTESPKVYPLLDSPSSTQQEQAAEETRRPAKRLVRRNKRLLQRSRTRRLKPVPEVSSSEAEEEPDQLHTRSVSQSDPERDGTVLEEMVVADRSSSRMQVTTVYSYDEDLFLEDGVTILIELDSSENAEQEETYSDREDDSKFAAEENYNSPDARTPCRTLESDLGPGVRGHAGLLDSNTVEVVSFADFVFSRPDVDHGTPEEDVTIEIPPVTAGSCDAAVDEQSIDTDRVLKLFQSFAKDAGTTRAQTPADDLACKVLDLLERSIQPDIPPDQDQASTPEIRSSMADDIDRQEGQAADVV